MLEKSKYFIMNDEGEILVLLSNHGVKTLLTLPEYGSKISEKNSLMEYILKVINKDDFIKIDEVKKIVRRKRTINNSLITEEVPFIKKFYFLYRQFDDEMIREINRISYETGYEPHFISLEYLEYLILLNDLSERRKLEISNVFEQVKKLKLINKLEGDV